MNYRPKIRSGIMCYRAGRDGCTGFATLAESYNSVQTWPEAGEASADMFVCGVNAVAVAGLAVMVQPPNAQLAKTMGGSKRTLLPQAPAAPI